jgi:hypothetical protein
MNETVNIYCDESCHLENDKQAAMVLGAVWCPADRAREIAQRVREIKVEHGLKPDFEVKWTKVSPGKPRLYADLLDYFFDNSDLHFRALVVPDKARLSHGGFRQSHDTWYYKMYFDMLKVLLAPDGRYRIYLDIKDTRGAAKVRKLHDVLCNNMYDFHHEIIERVQTVRSHEVEQLQLTDLLIGIVSAAHRNVTTSPAKLRLVDRMRKRSGYSLLKTTLLREDKVNLFRWEAREAQS